MSRLNHCIGAAAGLVLACFALAPAAHAARLSAVQTIPGQIDVFGRDPATGQLRQTTYTQSTGRWSAWVLKGGTIDADSDVSVVSRSAGAFDAFYMTESGDLRQRSYTAAGASTNTLIGTAKIDAGPTAVVTGATIQLLARNAADATLVRSSWNPSTGAQTTATSNWSMTAGTGPGGATPNGSQVQVVLTDTERPWLNLLTPAGTVPWDLYATRTGLPGRTTGTPAVTMQSSGATDITLRAVVGTIVRMSRVSTTAAWPASYTSLPNPPGNQLAGSSPAALRYRSSATASPVLQTYLPAASGNTFLMQTGTGAWATITPGSTVTTPPVTPPTPPVTPPTPPVTPPNTGSATPSVNGPAALTPGTIRYFGRTRSGAWDSWFQPANTPTANRTWLNNEVWRLEMFEPSGNPATSWFTGGMLYGQLYTIDAATAAAHPTWVMRDTAGNPLYAADGATPHNLVAGNIFDPSYRAYQVARLVNKVASAGYRGLWLDNVNLELGDSGLVKQLAQTGSGWSSAGTLVGAITGKNSSGAYNVPAVAPSGTIPAGTGCTAQTIPAAGTRITDTCWAVGIAQLTTQIRAALPAAKELLINTPWYRYQRDVETYAFKRDTSGTNVGRATGGLPTTPGQSVVAASTYADLEGAFWNNADPSGPGPAAAPLTGHSASDYSLDMIFRWVDAVHAAGKGIVADNWDEGTSGGVGVAAELPLRIKEFNLAGYLLTTNGKDGIGDYDQTNVTWPKITGTGGANLYDMNIGTASALPAGVTSSGVSADGRGVATIGSAGNRLWVRAFTRTDGKKVYVLLSEPGSGSAETSGNPVTFTLPVTGCSDMTHAAGRPASYASLNPSTRVATLSPRSALFVLC